MKDNKIQFETLLQQIASLLTLAAETKDPAMYLFTNDLRTPLFYLEGLSRIYAATGPQKKTFKKLLQKFKLLEDMLGSIDYYEDLNKKLSKKSNLPEFIKSHFLVPGKNAVSDLNEVLTHFDWLNGKQLEEIQQDLAAVNWKDAKEEHKRLKQFYEDEITKITTFANNGDPSFSDMEDGIHELRRKLRWLSIYAHALQGAVQLVDIEKERSSLDSYLSDTVLNSPFNKLREVPDDTIPLLLSKYNFYALSWIIGRLGELKDEGLIMLSLAQAFSQTQVVQNEEEALQKATEALGENTTPLAELLAEGNRITRQFFKDKVLKHLLI